MTTIFFWIRIEQIFREICITMLCWFLCRSGATLLVLFLFFLLIQVIWLHWLALCLDLQTLVLFSIIRRYPRLIFSITGDIIVITYRRITHRLWFLLLNFTAFINILARLMLRNLISHRIFCVLLSPTSSLRRFHINDLVLMICLWTLLLLMMAMAMICIDFGFIRIFKTCLAFILA